MKKIIISASLLIFALVVSAQDNLPQILESIEHNNTSLKAYREQTDANKIGNKTSLNLNNPEVEFEYAWGSPKATEGKEINLNVSQSFDFPTAYKHRSRLSKEQNKQLDLLYRDQLRDIQHEVRQLYVKLVYTKNLDAELSQRYKQSKELSDAYQKLFDEGSINVLDRNKTRLNFLNMEKKLDMNKIELEAYKSELVRMNGGEALAVLAGSFPNYDPPLHFDQWVVHAVESNPTTAMNVQNVAISKQDEQLTRSLNLPKLSAGYVSEYTKGASQHGFSLGVSIPLWGGRNTVKYKKAQTNALRMLQIDGELQARNQLKKDYDRALKLQKLVKDYEQIVESTSNNALLRKAFDQGQLSLINYFIELEVLYDTTDSYLEVQKDYYLVLTELMQWE